MTALPIWLILAAQLNIATRACAHAHITILQPFSWFMYDGPAGIRGLQKPYRPDALPYTSVEAIKVEQCNSNLSIKLSIAVSQIFILTLSLTGYFILFFLPLKSVSFFADTAFINSHKKFHNNELPTCRYGSYILKTALEHKALHYIN